MQRDEGGIVGLKDTSEQAFAEETTDRWYGGLDHNLMDWLHAHGSS